jgi:hypothetical protein
MKSAGPALLALAIAAATACGAAAQTSAAAFVVYETPSPIYATALPLYATPEITVASPVSFAIGDPGLGQRPLARKHEFVAPAYYAEVVSRGSMPSLTGSRCVTDLGNGRWEACD